MMKLPCAGPCTHLLFVIIINLGVRQLFILFVRRLFFRLVSLGSCPGLGCCRRCRSSIFIIVALLLGGGLLLGSGCRLGFASCSLGYWLGCLQSMRTCSDSAFQLRTA
jgi:hypothetical protein